MKKKLLSLLMAAAVVAGVGVPAHAQIYEANESDTIDANVTVTGTVRNQDGVAPGGKLMVEVPTTLSFTVDQNGSFTVPTYTIKNRSSVGVQVAVGSFKETVPNGGITLHDNESALATKDRSHIVLTLRGNAGDVKLVEGVAGGTVISEINPSDSDNIVLTGKAGSTASSPGTGVDANGATEDFNLVFKIKKN